MSFELNAKGARYGISHCTLLPRAVYRHKLFNLSFIYIGCAFKVLQNDVKIA